METELCAAPSDGTKSTYAPRMWKPSSVDQNNNRIADALDQEIVRRTANGTSTQCVNVILALKSEPMVSDADAFAQCGGYVTTSPWKHAIYGFGGNIAYSNILAFTQRNPNVLLVEKEAVFHATMAHLAACMHKCSRA